MIKSVYDIILAITSMEGFTKDGIFIKCKSLCSFTVSVLNDQVNIDFSKDGPVVTFEKDLGIIKPKIAVSVIGIVLYKNSGLIKLKNFIDIPFKYE